jgi:hypothetical protein
MGLVLGSRTVANAGPLVDPGPGFAVSGYQVSANANTGTLLDSGIDSILGSIATAGVFFDPFFNANSEADGFALSASGVTAITGGGGSVGAGADGKSSYGISGTPPGTVTHFIVTFDVEGTLVAVPTGSGLDLAFGVFDPTMLLVSDKGTVTAGGITDTTDTLGQAPSLSGHPNFSVTPDPSTQGEFDLSGIISAEIDATSFLEISDGIQLSVSVNGAESQDTLNMNLGSITYANSSNTPPVLTGVPPVTPIQAPEPSTWTLVLTAGSALWASRRVLLSRSFRGAARSHTVSD